jgi:DNA-binding NtrC family response regulator/tetratricopeptide (TPR) repeat protein
MLPAAPAALLDVLDGAREGSPRWVSTDVRDHKHATRLARVAAAEARQRGFVPLLVPLYFRLRDALAAELDERTLLLISHAEPDATDARAALLQAATRCARPHVLLTFRTASASQALCTAKEARALYRTDASRRPGGTSELTPDLAKFVERSQRALEFSRAGRHAAAERTLREVAGSLARRQAFELASRTTLNLGRMLLERGRAPAAERAFEEAAQYGRSSAITSAEEEARLWQATARVDIARLTDAESIARAVLLANPADSVRHRWAQAVLARVLMWQGRVDEAVTSCLPVVLLAHNTSSNERMVGPVDSVVAASASAISVRLLVASGDLFRAGLRAHELTASMAGEPEPLPRVIAATAHLRVLTAAGQLDFAEQRLREIVQLAKAARSPLRAARACVIWHDALCQAGRSEDAHRALARVSRMSRVAPTLLKREIERRMAGLPVGRSAVVAGPCSHTLRVAPALVPSLVRLAQEEEDDDAAMRQLIERVGRELQSVRLDLVSNDAGPVSVLISVGTGLPTRLGGRVVESGITIVDDADGGKEIGVPIRLGARLLGALAARWPFDRRPGGGAQETLEIAAAVAAPRLESLLAGRRETARSSTAVPELIGASAAIADVRRAIERAARAPFAVLIEGESGVGKELAARAVHQLGPRRDRRFCDVNCAALPDELLESELFGHVKGAFTGAVADKPGLFEEANGGTLFLDEVADLSLRGQAKLLRVLQQHEVRRVGETFSRKVDVRVVTAANRDMRAEVAGNRFRLDLLYRLDVIRIRIPPLRERPEDIAILADHFWRASSARVGCTATLTHGVMSALASYHWPGNVRELQNVMAALAVAAPSRGSVRASRLPAAITGSARVTSCRLADARAEFERRCVEVALARAGGSRTRAATALGLSRQGLLKTMARLGFESAPG